MVARIFDLIGFSESYEELTLSSKLYSRQIGWCELMRIVVVWVSYFLRYIPTLV